MILSEAGESRVNGYLFVLRRSLSTSLPREVAQNAAREIESHLRERIAGATVFPDERTSLERILAELGPPLRVAQAYSAERLIDEAVITGRFVPIARAIWHLAFTTVLGFLAAFGLFAGYALGAGFLLIAALKPIFPNHVGFWVDDGWNGYPTNLSLNFNPPPGQYPAGGYWVIVIGLVFGLGLLVLTHRGARAFLGWVRSRRSLGPGFPDTQ